MLDVTEKDGIVLRGTLTTISLALLVVRASMLTFSWHCLGTKKKRRTREKWQSLSTSTKSSKGKHSPISGSTLKKEPHTMVVNVSQNIAFISSAKCWYLGEDLNASSLHLVQIYFDTATFDEIERDEKVKSSLLAHLLSWFVLGIICNLYIGQVRRATQSHRGHNGTSLWIFNHQRNRDFPFPGQARHILQDQERMRTSQQIRKNDTVLFFSF